MTRPWYRPDSRANGQIRAGMVSLSYSTTAGSDLRRRWINWGGPILVATVIGAVVYLLFVALFEPNAKERQVCDALVQTLLTTRDVVELQRGHLRARARL